MSVTTSTPQQICNSPLNTSTSKMLFSFPKAPKFGVDARPVCAQAFYDLPPLKDTRSPGFGYGTRSDFTTSSVNTPAPNNYKPTESFVPGKKKGFSFGLSREKMQITGGMFVGDKNSPGPGAYDTREANKVIVAYTFKSRTAAGADGLTTRRHVPGPGSYPVYDTITPNGKLFVSKYKNSGAPSIPPARSARFPELKESKVPGPGQYNTQVGISPTGEYVLSKFKASLGRSFGHGLRSSSSQPSLSKMPGPGSYRVPSDFGYYEAANKSQLDISGVKTERKTGAASSQVTPRKLE